VYKYTVGLLNNAFKVHYSLGLYYWVNVTHANKQQKNIIDTHFHSQINMHESLDLQQLYKPHPDSHTAFICPRDHCKPAVSHSSSWDCTQ